MEPRYLQLNNGVTLEYFLSFGRVRGLKVSILKYGKIKVTRSRFVTIKKVEEFLIQKQEWIIEHSLKKQNRDEMKKENLSEHRKFYHKNKFQIYKKFEERINFWNSYLKLPFRSLIVKPLSAKWGSCTSSKVITLNSLLIEYPNVFLDYVIVHELCHLREMNHSGRFYALLKQVLPDYKEIEKELKKVSNFEVS